MRGVRDKGEPVHKPCTSSGARRRRAKRIAEAARLSAELDRSRQALAAEAEVHAAQLAAAERARAARDNTDLIRDAVADAHNARLEARFQQGLESRLDLESAANSQRLADAAARVAREEALRLDLESRAAALQGALLASQRELAHLRALRDRSSPPPPTPAVPAVGAVATSAAVAASSAAVDSAQPTALDPDARDKTITQLRFCVRELSGTALQRSVAAAAAFVRNPANDLFSAPPVCDEPLPPPLVAP
jgi:hypothetical protein